MLGLPLRSVVGLPLSGSRNDNVPTSARVRHDMCFGHCWSSHVRSPTRVTWIFAYPGAQVWTLAARQLLVSRTWPMPSACATCTTTSRGSTSRSRSSMTTVCGPSALRRWPLASPITSGHCARSPRYSVQTDPLPQCPCSMPSTPNVWSWLPATRGRHDLNPEAPRLRQDQPRAARLSPSPDPHARAAGSSAISELKSRLPFREITCDARCHRGTRRVGLTEGRVGASELVAPLTACRDGCATG
jgi:hypothetical protein